MLIAATAGAFPMSMVAVPMLVVTVISMLAVLALR
jgi:hypothetical protein